MLARHRHRRGRHAAACSQEALRARGGHDLQHASTVDGDMSHQRHRPSPSPTASRGTRRIAEAGPDYETLRAPRSPTCAARWRATIAADGEGATKLVEVVVTERSEHGHARDCATAIAVSPLVKAALFGADPNWGRVLATVGARAGSQDYPIDP